MNTKNTISVVISAYNEQKKIKNCLESCKWADEIIFVDNSSTDDTVKIANLYTQKIYFQKNDPFNIDLQKNLGIEKAKGDWTFLLDADEVITPELKKEILETINITPPLQKDLKHPPSLIKGDGGISSMEISGYMVPRKNIIFGKWIRHCGWYPDYQLRLFRTGLGKYQKKHVHEPINIVGITGKLSEHLLHYNYETVSQFLYKHLSIYAPNEAEELLHKGFKFDWRGVIRMPVSEFLSRYFAREGYKDGFHGLILSLLMGVYHLAIFTYLWEKKNFINFENEKIIDGFEEELNKSKKDLNFWINKIKIDHEQNSLKKISLKIKKKIF